MTSLMAVSVSAFAKLAYAKNKPTRRLGLMSGNGLSIYTMSSWLFQACAQLQGAVEGRHNVQLFFVFCFCGFALHSLFALHGRCGKVAVSGGSTVSREIVTHKKKESIHFYSYTLLNELYFSQ